MDAGNKTRALHASEFDLQNTKDKLKMATRDEFAKRYFTQQQSDTRIQVDTKYSLGFLFCVCHRHVEPTIPKRHQNCFKSIRKG
jgi:hypothetical protein